MYRVMLVEDEIYFRKALAVSFNWAEYGFEICGEADDGEKALEYLDIFKPDLALVDINLSFINGLDFIKQAREMRPNLKYIIITGYADFKYAQQAIDLGVDSFLLKPVKEDELKNALIEVKNKIENEKDLKIELDNLKTKLKESLPIAKEKLLADLMEGKWLMDNQDLKKKLEYLGIDMHDVFYKVVTVGIDTMKSEVSSQTDLQLRKLAVENISSKILGYDFQVEKCTDSEDRIRFVIIGQNLNAIDTHSRILDACIRIINSVEEHMDFAISAGIGNTYRNIRDVSISYQESLVALKSNMLPGKNNVIFYDTIEETGLKTNLYCCDHMNRLLMGLRTFNKSDISSFIDEVLMPFSEKSESNDMMLTCIKLITTAGEYLTENKESFESIFSCDIYSIFQQYDRKKTFTEISDWIKNILFKVNDTIKDKKFEQGHLLVSKAKKYIEAHYKDNELKVETVAGSVYINPTYLGNLFRKFLGVTVIEYLTNVRMQKAKELLDNDYCIIGSIAEQVGFSDAGYFSKSFKKYYGISPKQYYESRSEH